MEEEEAVAHAVSAVLSTGFVSPDTARRLGLLLPSVTELRLSIVATPEDMVTTGSLLRPQQLTVSVELMAGSEAGSCVISGRPIVSLQPTPQLRVPIAPTQHALLPGLPRAQGCLLLVFDTGHASTIFRCAAALAHGLAETLPHDAAPLLAEVRSLMAAQPWEQLAEQYVVQVQLPGHSGASSVLALAQHAGCGRAAHNGAVARGPPDEAAAHHADSATPPEATGNTPHIGNSSGDEAASAGSEIQPCTWASDRVATRSSCADAAAWASATDGSPPTLRWAQPDAERQQLLQAAADSDDIRCAKLMHWQPDAEFFLRDGPPRQSCATLCFADWRLEQLFQPWRAATCSQDDGRAAPVMAPLVLLAGFCRPLRLFAGRAGAVQWAGHAALLLAYLLVRLLLACSPAGRAPAWRQHALVLLWAAAAAHAAHQLMAEGWAAGKWQSPLVFFRTSGLQTLAIGALVLRVQWAWALPLVAAHALVAMQHLPACCPAAVDGGGGDAADWARGLACGRGAAAIATHWLLMGMLPAVVMRGIDSALRRQFVRQLRSSCS